MKTLEQLADEYDESVKGIEEIVIATRAQMRKARLQYNNDEVKRLASKLAVLYEEIRDMRIISEQLRNYYTEEEKLQEAV